MENQNGMTRRFPLHAIRAPGLTILALVALVPAAVAQDTPPVAPDDPYVVGAALPPVEGGRPIVSLTLDEAIAIALESNLDIQSARLNPQIQRFTYQIAETAFDPSFNTSLSYNNSTNQSTSQLDGGTRTTTERNTLNFSVSQPLPWYGASLSTSFNNARTSTDNIFATRNPSYSSSFSLNLSQPLLQGRRIDNQRNQLRTQEIQREITDVQLSNQMDNLSNQVRVGYWNLRSQIEQIEIQRRSLAQAEQLLANNRIRVELGTMVEMELAQAEVQVANAQQALLNAEIQWRQQELAFKRLLAGGADDPVFGQTINPVDLPAQAQAEPDVDIEAAIERALLRRPDLRTQVRQREIAEMNLEVTRDGTRPNMNLNASYSLQGVGGNRFDRTGLGGEPQLIEEGGYLDGLQSILGFDTPTFNVSVNFSYPLGMRSARANLERARLQLRQSEIALQSQQLQIETEVTNAGMAVTNTFLQLQAATRSREAAERSVEAELTRFQVGASTNFQVVNAQDNLTSARLSELRAIINHINALAEFERVQGLDELDFPWDDG
jgi:outer membrane protein TolC